MAKLWIAVDLLSFAVVTITLVASESYQEYVYDSLNCTEGEYSVTKNTSYTLKWHGCNNPACKVTFKPENQDHKVCINSTYYDVTDCSTLLEIYFGSPGSDVMEKVYRCADDKFESICGDTGESISVMVRYLTAQVGDYSGMFELHISADDDDDEELSVAVLVVAIVVPTVVVGIAVILAILCCALRAKRRREMFTAMMQQNNQNMANYPRNNAFSTYNSTPGGPGSAYQYSNNSTDPPAYQSSTTTTTPSPK